MWYTRCISTAELDTIKSRLLRNNLVYKTAVNEALEGLAFNSIHSNFIILIALFSALHCLIKDLIPLQVTNLRSLSAAVALLCSLQAV
jgi:hypothetical protein